MPARARHPFLLAALLTAFLSAPALAQGAGDLSRIKLPRGFAIELFARVPDARSLAVAAGLGVVFVGNRRGASVFAAIDADGDGRAERVVRILSGLAMPNGVAWRDGYLYVAERTRVLRIPVPDRRSLGQKRPEVVFEGLPDKGHHGWRYIAFDQLGRLHVSVGAPCNVCRPSGVEGTILRLVLGAPPVIVARGVRNSVGMDFHPVTGGLFFTDNGADNMGDETPPDELNRASGEGLHFGYPHYGGGRARTPRFRAEPAPSAAIFPIVDFRAHVAALGIHFYRGGRFPGDYRTSAYVAQHGSWNRTQPIGYRIMRIPFDRRGQPGRKVVFAEGWLGPDGVSGRPVDIKELPDGSLLVSDDHADAVYRIAWRG